jgi:hypothetical protein
MNNGRIVEFLEERSMTPALKLLCADLQLSNKGKLKGLTMPFSEIIQFYDKYATNKTMEKWQGYQEGQEGHEAQEVARRGRF